MEFRVTSTLVWLLVLGASSFSLAEKLSPGQKAPPFAKGSGGLALETPRQSGPRAADVGQRRSDPPPPAAPAPAPAAPSAPAGGGNVMRDETAEYKLVDGKPVRVVKGSYSYLSPEGIPVAVNYVADENGNHAGFKIGSAVGGAGSPGSSTTGLTPTEPRAPSPDGSSKAPTGSTDAGTPGGANGSQAPPGGGNGSEAPGGGGGGDSTYLPPAETPKPDRRYLPPSK